METWKGVKRYEDLYEVSSLGRVRSLPRICRKLEGTVMKAYLYEGKILKPYRSHKGYLLVRLYRNDKTKDMTVHRLVAEAFIPNPDNLPQINHKDENKTNNSVENLEWCTNAYNRNYGSGFFRHKKPVAQYDMNGRFLASYPSRKDAARSIGISAATISAVISGRLKTAGGFVWLTL